MEYSKPQLRFVATKAEDAVADICWAYATGHSGKSFYLNTPGPGYAELAIYETTGGCDGAIVTIVGYHNGASAATGEAAIKEALAIAGGNSAEPFKGSPFEKKVSSKWS